MSSPLEVARDSILDVSVFASRLYENVGDPRWNRLLSLFVLFAAQNAAIVATSRFETDVTIARVAAVVSLIAAQPVALVFAFLNALAPARADVFDARVDVLDAIIRVCTTISTLAAIFCLVSVAVSRRRGADGRARVRTVRAGLRDRTALSSRRPGPFRGGTYSKTTAPPSHA